MEVLLTSDQKAFIRQAIETGRLHREEDAVVREALSLWEERERRRLEILACVSKADASLARGGGRTVTSREQVTQLPDDVKRRRHGEARRRKRQVVMAEFRSLILTRAGDAFNL